jgi:hypothetical protein
LCRCHGCPDFRLMIFSSSARSLPSQPRKCRRHGYPDLDHHDPLEAVPLTPRARQR